MLGLTAQKTGAGESSPQPAPYPSSTVASRHANCTAEDPRLLALRRQFEPFGVSVYRMPGDELALTGLGFSRSVPDDRGAWVYLRQLRGGQA